MQNLISICIRSRKSLNLLFFGVLFFGYWSFYTARRECFPSVDLGTIVISSIYPGATAKIVEKLVTSKLEEQLVGISGLRKITSISTQERSYIIFQIEDAFIKENNRIVFDVQKAVDKTILPEKLHKKPSVLNQKIGILPVIKLVITHESDEENHAIVEKLELDIRKIHGIGDVEKTGYREREISIEVDPQKLIERDVTLLEVINAIKNSSTTFPGGKIRVDNVETSIRIYNNFLQLADVRNTVIAANSYGNSVLVNDVAKVSLVYANNSTTTKVRSEGNNVISLQVLKSENGDIIDVCEKVRKLVKQYKNNSQINNNCKIAIVDDLSTVVRTRLNVLANNAWWGIGLVFLCLILFLDIKITIWSSLGLPFAFCLAQMISSAWFGITINLISMFGFIIVVGMLVDDSIVVAENIQSHKLRGKSNTDAAIDGVSEVFLPVLACVFTTIAAFLPMLLFEGVIGRMLKEIPIVVTIAMLSSLVECLFILPMHLAEEETNKNTRWKIVPQFIFTGVQIASQSMIFLRASIMHSLIRTHSWSLQKVLRRPFIFFSTTSIVCTSIIVISFSKIPWNPFPGEVTEYRILCEFPKKITKNLLEKQIDSIEDHLRKSLPQTDILEYISYVGFWAKQGTSVEYSPNLGFVEINLKPYQERKYSSEEIESKLRSTLENLYNSGTLQFIFEITKDSGGPPKGREIEVQVSAPNYDELIVPSKDLEELLSSLPNTADIYNGSRRKDNQISIRFDRKRASQLGVNLKHASMLLGSALGSVEIAKETELLEKEIGVIVRLPSKEKESLAILEKLYVRNQRDSLVNLKQFCQIQVEEVPSMYNRSRGYLVNYIGTGVRDIKNVRQNASYIRDLLRKELPKFREKYPQVTMSLSGESEEVSRLGWSVTKASIVTVVLIFFILTTLFQSTILPLVIMSAIPFGLAGMCLGVGFHYILSFFINIEPHLYSFSMTMMIGMAALFGIVVNDSCVIVTLMENLRQQGYSLQHAVFVGSLSRVRAVVLTTITTLVGMGPFSYGFIGGGEPFLQPMGIAVIWGVALATIVTLLIIPCIYALIRVYFWGDTYTQENDLQEITNKMR